MSTLLEPTPVWRFLARRRLPVMVQSEAAECGLVCLAMIASHWGHRVDIAGLRRRYSISLKGVTLKGLVGMAAGLQLAARPLQAPLDALPGLKLPCVLHWDMGHFVVLKSVRRGRWTLHDPAIGVRVLSQQEVSLHYTGVALELSPADGFKPQEARLNITVGALIGKVVGLRRSLAQLLLMALCLQVCALVAPFYVQWIVDEAVVAADRNLVTVLGLGFLLLALMQTAIGAVRSWVTTAMATDLNYQWFGNSFAHLLSLPLAFFEKRHQGDIVSRFSSISTIQHGLTNQAVEAVVDGLMVVGSLVIMVVYSPWLTAVPLTAVALYAGLRWGLFRQVREATAQQIVHAARQQTHFMESARGVQSIRLFGRANERRTHWLNLLVDQFNAELRLARLSVSQQTANNLLFGCERILLVWLAAYAVLDSRFSVGMLFAFVAYKEQFCTRMVSLIDKLSDLRMLRVHADRVADILLTAPEDLASTGVGDEVAVAPTIELRNLSFRYADGEPWVLRNLNLRIPAGQCVALTGASGCGKTTLVKLMLGLLQPTEGEVLVGGMPMRAGTLAAFRAMVGTVMQDDQLFAGSIAENISFFAPDADAQRIQASAQAAAIHDEIMAMPMGYSTLVGDIGSGLSGGQRQRLLMARALYRQPQVLIMDEATSHLDTRNEQLVNAALRQVAVTRVLVAHRTETIGLAQRVVVLDRGTVLKDFEQQAAGGGAARQA